MSLQSLNSKDGEKTKSSKKNKALQTILKRSNSKAATSKVKDERNLSSHLELEPGNELIMCAKLNIVTLKSYPKDMEKYLEITS